MNKKVILVLIDALNYKVGVSAMGFLNHLVEHKIASQHKVRTELPSLSRPLYETILTGTPCYINGIFTNQTNRISKEKSIFYIARENGLKTGAAAYYWISELYNKSPFNYIEDREQENEENAIQYGKFYFEDSYPDSHLFLDGEIIRKKHDPNFLLIHPMGVDYVGHKYGCNSREYREKVIEIDSILGNLVPAWIELGYEIIITGDHGMDSLGLHCGIEEDERYVPMWIISDSYKLDEKEISQLSIAPIICNILKIPKSEKMI